MTDFNAQIVDLRAKKAQLVNKAESLAADGAIEELNQVKDQLHALNDRMNTLMDLAQESQQDAQAVYDGVLHQQEGQQAKDKQEGLHLFDSLGEQLQAIYKATSGVVDARLTTLNNAAQGLNEGTGADGGFLLQTDFASAIMESAVERSPLLNRLDRYTCSAASNSMRWLSVAESDVSTSVFGGVQMYWAAEAQNVADSKPQFKEMKLDLEKMMGFGYVTDEMLTDAAFLSQFLSNAFSLAGDRLLTESVISGDGVGKPLGILNSPALITVDKAPSQAAGTLLGTNVIKMQSRTPFRNRSKMVWLAHPDLEELMPELTVGKGAAERLLWSPEGGLGGFDTQRVLNKPVIYEDSCSAVGDKGDLMLVDPMSYILLAKGTVRQDWSMHVQFLTDQHCFRVIYRCNGKPKVDSAVKIKNSKNTRSPFVTLAERK